MDRRRFLVSVCTAGITGSAGCLSSTECDRTSNHLYVENQRVEPQEIEIDVMKESEEVFSDSEWENIFQDTMEIPGETHRVVEGVYNEHGIYRTTAEQQVDHRVFSDQETLEIDDCHNHSITIGIADDYLSILTGVPDHLSSENRSDSDPAFSRHRFPK